MAGIKLHITSGTFIDQINTSIIIHLKEMAYSNDFYDINYIIFMIQIYMVNYMTSHDSLHLQCP